MSEKIKVDNPLKDKWQEFEAVIFDMDGTLVDSMWMWEEIDREYLGRYGIEVPGDLQTAIGGMSFSETAVYMKQRFELPDSVEEMKTAWNEMACDKYRFEVPFKPGAQEFLQACRKKGIRLGVATSNSRELVENVAEALGFYEYVSCIITSCEVKKGKPAPDVYLAVAEKLHVRAERCLVFEDIVPGMQAGKAAGMTVCGVEDRYVKDSREEKERTADYYIEDYCELL